MSVTSPTSASPSASLLEWDESAVQSYMDHIGLPQYEDVIIEHGITGDVLAMMDHSALQDLGMTSIGHRLNLLRAVWELKREQGIALGEDDWRPQDAEQEEKKNQALNVDRLWNLILEQQERLVGLERDHARLLSSLEANGLRVTAQRSNGDTKQNLQWKDFNRRQSDSEDADLSTSKASRRASQIFPSSLASSTSSYAPAPLSSDSATFKDSFTPTNPSASYPFDSPTHPPVNGSKPSSNPPPPFTRMLSGSSIVTTSTPPSQTLARSLTTSATSRTKPPTLASSATSSTALLASTTTATSVSPTPPQGMMGDLKDKSEGGARGFRVTLDDPCWKVLPAALKKYKIDDDWKVYALFICFGTSEERCLSYDEKPLMLFQKLKESGQKPVFMLRHIRDIKSPIAVAQQKQAIKLSLPPTTIENVLPQLKPADDTTSSPTKATALKPSQRADTDGTTPVVSAFPELPSPGLPGGEGSGHGGPRSAGTRTLVDKDGNAQNISYAVAIYPYIADRQDEFDVAVGACYVIMSKAKGWYIVQRDPLGMGNITPDQSKSGWVPAGCLLELHSPISTFASNTSDMQYPGLAPVPPSAIVSSSYPGVVLMDWEKKSEDQASMKEGERVRVYKKYCHWSYVIKTETGERGWVPAWFIGKLAVSSSGAAAADSTQIVSAASSTVLGANQTPSTGSTVTGANGAGREVEIA